MSGRITHNGVVVGVDGSPSSRVAVRWAAREAMMRNVPLTLAHVAAPSAVGSVPVAWPAAPIPEEVLQRRDEDARNIIADAIKVVEDSADSGDRPEINGEVLYGGPVPTLVDLSKDAQMVVAGCRGRSALRRGLLGSVSTGLIHHAHCPVAVIHDEGPSSLQSAQLPVLVGIDGSRASEAATAIAFDEASWRGVDLVALHVWSDADVSHLPSLEWSAVEAAAEKLWPSASPAGRNAIQTSPSTVCRSGPSLPVTYSSSPRGLSSSLSAATAAADSPGCCSVRSAPPSRRPRASR